MYALLNGASRALAWIGGATLCAMILLTCLSILGRGLNGVLNDASDLSAVGPVADWLLALGIGPVTGDYELVEMGVAFAIFSFLPICQQSGGHASVDIFTRRLPGRVGTALLAAIEVLFAIVLIVIAVQLGAGMLGKRAAGQVTFLLQVPVWWGYALCLPGATLASCVAVWRAVARVVEASTGRVILPPDPVSR